MGGDGGCRVGEVRAGTTSPMPDHKGFKLQKLVNFQKFSTVRVKICPHRIEEHFKVYNGIEIGLHGRQVFSHMSSVELMSKDVVIIQQQIYYRSFPYTTPGHYSENPYLITLIF